jgi:hypothetical protein
MHFSVIVDDVTLGDGDERGAVVAEASLPSPPMHFLT